MSTHFFVAFQGENIGVKLSSKISLIKLLQEDELVGLLYDGFKNRLGEGLSEQENMYQGIVPLLVKEHLRIESIRESPFDTLTRLALVHENVPDVFSEIQASFQAIFPMVKELRVLTKSRGNTQIKLDKYPTTQATEIAIYFRETGVDYWLGKEQMSSGMWKTLMVLADHYLFPNNSVLLVDEFENSLGVNCIDVIGDLDASDRGLQYIITSHHPYIINHIPISQWKIVTRNQGRVEVKPPADFRLGNSKHEAFMQLMQLDAFTRGIA